MSLREAQKQLTRDRIVNSALQLFTDKGYSATTIDDIATAAGTTRMTFYAYYPTRLDLMSDFMGRVNSILDRIDASDHTSSAPALVDVVREGTLDGIYAWLVDRSELWKEFRPYLDVLDQAAAVDREVKTLLSAWHGEVIKDLVRGMEQEGRFDPSLRDIRATLAFTQLNYISTLWTLRSSKDKRQQALEVLAGSWFHLLCQH